MNSPLWTLNDVTLAGRASARLAGVTLDIPTGATAVIGASGAGKTSLLNLLVGFEKPSAGRLERRVATTNGVPPLFWSPADGGLWPHLSVTEHLAHAAPADAASRKRVTCLLDEFDLAQLAAARPDSLSAGERSRLSVARALASGAATLVLDEPLVHVDSRRQEQCWDALRRDCRQRGVNIVFSAHDPDTVLREGDAVICLNHGHVEWTGPTRELYQSPPTEELARYLGPVNWFSPAEASRWLSSDFHAPVALRPERLQVQPADGGCGEVITARFSGAVAQVDLRHVAGGDERRVYHRPPGDYLRAGMRVALSIVGAICLLVAAAGCAEETGPNTLPITTFRTKSLPVEGAQLPAPRAMTVAASQELIILDSVGRVLMYAPDLTFVRSWWMPEYSAGRPEGACVMHDGRIAIADTHYHRMVLADHDGHVERMFGKEGEAPGEFTFPCKVIQDPSGNLYVSEYGGNDRVQKFTPDGEFLLEFGQPGTGPGELQRANGLAWHDGKVYVADGVNNRVQVFTDVGKFVEVLTDDVPGGLEFPYDLTLAGDGTLYVVEFGAGRVTRLSLTGELLGRYGTTGRGNEQFWTPWGVAVADDGRIFVGDTGNRRIVELIP